MIWRSPTSAKWFAGALLLLSAYGFGLATYRNNWPPLSTWRGLRGQTRTYAYFADVTGKTVTPCPGSQARTAVILALGQSNASNTSNGGAPEPHVRAGPAVVNFFDGACYVAEDPLLGSDGGGNSVWTLVAGHLITERAFDKVVIAPFTMSATTIRDWTEKQYFQRRLDRVVADLTRTGLAPTSVVWFQGEADNLAHTTGEAYAMQFEAFSRSLRARGVSAPVYVSLTTLCQHPPDAGLRAAQQRLLSLDGIRSGPDTDALGYGYRWDGCHFTPEGRVAVARMWADALLGR